MFEKLEKFMEQENIYLNDGGDSALQGLNRICKELGYKENGFKYGSSFEQFISDNPGVIEKIIEWICDNPPEEWEESINNLVEVDPYEKIEKVAEDNDLIVDYLYSGRGMFDLRNLGD